MNWFSKMKYCKEFKKQPIAYFCAEYALFNHTPLYTGGLGILSGDYINEIIDEGLPVIAFGLFYHKEHQHGLELSRERKTPTELGLILATKSDGSLLKIPLQIEDRIVYIQVWTYTKSNMNLYLLDTQVEENSPKDWEISDTLYVEDRHLRLLQEIVLGIGSAKLIKILNIEPSVYHLNEGHSAFLIFELLRNELITQKNNGGINFDLACKNVKERIVFTNHTLVTAGQEMFEIDTIKLILEKYAHEINIDQILNLGIDANLRMFSMTSLALRMSRKVNAVSKIHARKALEEWKNCNVESITNGIYLKRWDMLGHYSHTEQKKKLLALIQGSCNVTLDENILLIGWARRFVDYKRPLAILENVDRFKKIALAENRKVAIVFSSIVNTTYTEENEYIKKLNALIENELKGIVVYIPNYNLEIAQLMTSGCDIWLNTPIVGLEACGTSGMKACLNGVLPFSTSDGWVDEVDLTNIGWVVGDDFISKNLLNTLERHIVPEFYTNKDGWHKRMKRARKLILDSFSTKRMLQEYIEKLYKN